MYHSSLPSFEIGPIRPPSEGGGNSLLVRLTRNCPWSRCKFCSATLYGKKKFELRPLADIKRDIDSIASIAASIRAASWRTGHAGEITDALAMAMLQEDPSLQRHGGFATVFAWLASGGQTAFLQDADSLVMRQEEMEEAIRYLRSTFPSLERVTTYARARTIFRKTPEQLKSLREAGLSRLHVGLETGDDDLLALVDKGVTAEQHIEAGRKARAAGFELSQYVMPDLGGRALWKQHAEGTARVLNSIDPDYVRFRSFIPRAGTPMYDDYTAGRFQLSSPHERLRELELLVGSLNVHSRLSFDHFSNSWRGRSGQPLFRRDYEGYKMPEEKDVLLSKIREGLDLDESAHVHTRELVGLSML
jgi:radical SAM superfamily enzyme YgiQ (UPF0313 family)